MSQTDSFGRVGHDSGSVMNPRNTKGDPRKPIYVKVVPEGTTQEEGKVVSQGELEASDNKEEVEIRLKDKSISTLVTEFSDNIFSILTEMTSIRTHEDAIDIFSKGERLTHLGVLFVLIAVSVLLVRNS